MCEKSFSKMAPMIRRYSMSHKVRGPNACSLCKRTFVRLFEMVRHQQNKKLRQCAACEKCYSKSGIKDHEKLHTSVTPRICEKCSQSYIFHAHLSRHQRKHREQQPIVCSHCVKQFSTKRCLTVHVERHTGGYTCPVWHLKWHQYKHTGQQPYLCDTCGKGWESVSQLRTHMIQHKGHSGVKTVACVTRALTAKPSIHSWGCWCARFAAKPLYWTVRWKITWRFTKVSGRLRVCVAKHPWEGFSEGHAQRRDVSPLNLKLFVHLYYNCSHVTCRTT